MRKNERGFSTVELLVCFIIVTTIVISMFDLIMSYKNRQQVESINSQMVTYKNTITKVIEDDVIRHGGVSSFYSSDKRTFLFTFLDHTTATLILFSNGENESSITYQGETFPTMDIPDMILRLDPSEEDSNSLSFGSCDGGGTLFLRIPFSHPDLTSAMGINLTIPCVPSS